MTVKKNDNIDKARILIVEDSITQAENLKYLLEQNSYSVVMASSGIEAVELIAREKPTVVITDIVMPGMSGYELCSRIKSDENTRYVPVILLTSLTNTEDVLEGLACGADNFISKPYNENYLLSNVENIILNIKLRQNERVRVGVEIDFKGKNRFITADQQQMLSMLISTYEAAVNRNNELLHAQEELTAMNEQLEDLVQKRTAELIQEIAERKAAAERLSLARDILVLLNRSDTGADTIRELLSMIKNYTGFEAIAIRLREKEDFPYYEALGLPDYFLKNGNSLCQYNDKGEILRTHDGRPSLKCLCGNILSGRVDAGQSFYTDYGSFWINNSAGLGNAVKKECHPPAEKIPCETEGYESVALIPLRLDNSIIGLFQLYDRRPGCFSLDTIRFFESLSASISIALKRKWTYEELQNKFNELQRWYNATLGREGRVQELKDEVNELLKESGRPPRYSGL